MRLIVLILFVQFLVACDAPDRAPDGSGIDVSVPSLSVLTVETLRQRDYGSTLKLETQIGDRSGGTPYSDAYGASGAGPYNTFMLSYLSDGLRLYSRVDIPNTTMPEGGYPVIIFCHGWVGIDAAPGFHFSYTPDSMYAELIDGYVDAGFVVFTPGYRGHGTVNGVPADGVEFMAAWDNASYLSPIFYAVDVLNLMDGLKTFDLAALDLSKVHLSGHSQGGDVVLNVLAIAGEGSTVKTRIAAATISDGTFPDRFTQVETYAPMLATPEAFLAGDGSWTGSAEGQDGSINPNFVFGYPPDWIETPQPARWAWQKESWPVATVKDAVRAKYTELYETLNANIGDLSNAGFEVSSKEGGRYTVRHDDRLRVGMNAIGAFRKPQFLTERLILHYTDRDLYSLPVWNEDLCTRVNEAGGSCTPFLYPGNNHLMRLSEHAWVSPAGSVESYGHILARDILLFSGGDPATIPFP